MKKTVLSILQLVGIPLVLGIIVFLVSQSEVAFELILVVSGFFEWIFLSIRVSRDDKKNMKERQTIKKDKASDAFKAYRRTQWILFTSGAINLLLSYLVFKIFGG